MSHPPREMSHPTTLPSTTLARTAVPFQRRSIRSLLRRLSPHFLYVVVPSRPFVSERLSFSCSLSLFLLLTLSLFLSSPSSLHAAFKLAFSLLSSEAADFPHFTFQSHRGCDFLPHFHSDNIAGRRRVVAERREKGEKRRI